MSTMRYDLTKLSRVLLRAGFATSCISVDLLAVTCWLLRFVGLSETPDPSIVDYARLKLDVEKTASPRRHPGGRFRRPGRRPGAQRSRRPHPAHRQEQPSPVPAAALSGSDRGAGRPGRLRADPPAALAPAQRHGSHGGGPAHRGGEEARPLREPPPRLRLPDRGNRD